MEQCRQKRFEVAKYKLQSKKKWVVKEPFKVKSPVTASVLPTIVEDVAEVVNHQTGGMM